jgi:hypothetical protein
MADVLNIRARQCCTREKDRLVKELRKCDSSAQSPEERHQCYRSAAIKSGSNSRQCLISG